MNNQSIRVTPAATLDLTGESPGKAAQVFDGIWLIATRHRPGLSKQMFEINNRCFVFRLQDQQANKPVLVVVNAVDPATGIPEVRRIEHETGLRVGATVTQLGNPFLVRRSDNLSDQCWIGPKEDLHLRGVEDSVHDFLVSAANIRPLRRQPIVLHRQSVCCDDFAKRALPCLSENLAFVGRLARLSGRGRQG